MKTFWENAKPMSLSKELRKRLKEINKIRMKEIEDMKKKHKENCGYK